MVCMAFVPLSELTGSVFFQFGLVQLRFFSSYGNWTWRHYMWHQNSAKPNSWCIVWGTSQCSASDMIMSLEIIRWKWTYIVFVIVTFLCNLSNLCLWNSFNWTAFATCFRLQNFCLISLSMTSSDLALASVSLVIVPWVWVTYLCCRNRYLHWVQGSILLLTVSWKYCESIQNNWIILSCTVSWEYNRYFYSIFT